MKHLNGKRTMIMTRLVKGGLGWYKPKAIYAWSDIGEYWYFAGWAR